MQSETFVTKIIETLILVIIISTVLCKSLEPSHVSGLCWLSFLFFKEITLRYFFCRISWRNKYGSATSWWYKAWCLKLGVYRYNFIPWVRWIFFVSSVCKQTKRCISLKIVRYKDAGRNEKGTSVKNKTTCSVAFATFCTSMLKYNMFFFVSFFLLHKVASISPLGPQQLRISASQTCLLICGRKLKHRLSSNNNRNHL